MTTVRSERPIIFTAESVQGILDGRKTQTRRVIIPQPFKAGDEWSSDTATAAWQSGFVDVKCPYGNRLDRLWVREAWVDCGGYIRYPATDDVHELRKIKSPRFMRRAASRITLEILEIRVQRVKEISEADAKAEGVRIPVCTDDECPPGKGRPLIDILTPYRPLEHGHEFRAQYAVKWEEINKKRGLGWDRNPWVWVVMFRRLQ